MYRSLQTDILTAEDDPCNETSEVCTRGKLKGCFRGDYDQWHSCGSTCCSITSKIQTSIKGSYGVLNSWKSLEVCPAIFQIWKKSGKMLKSLEFIFYFFQTYNKSFISDYFFRFGQILFNLVHTFSLHREKSLFLRFLRSVLITYLIT